MGDNVAYTWHSDPGHAWLEVDRAFLRELGIVDKITGYSYQSGSRVFLEEDCDATLFFEAYHARRGTYPATVDFYSDPCEVRSFAHFAPRTWDKL